jgi:hypothetical protein
MRFCAPIFAAICQSGPKLREPEQSILRTRIGRCFG